MSETCALEGLAEQNDCGPTLSIEERNFRRHVELGKPYFGRLYDAFQGRAVRHATMQALLERASAARGGDPFQILEVGSWAGGSAITWADALKRYHGGRGRVVCVDPWKVYFQPEECSELPDATRYERMRDALLSGRILELFFYNLRTSGHDDVVAPFRGHSADLLPLFADATFDLVFIDGAHDYPSVRGDLQHGSRLVKEGGILCGDDLELQLADLEGDQAHRNRERDYICDPGSGTWFHPGVTLAVGELLGRVSSLDGFWAVRKCGDYWEPFDLVSSTGAAAPIPGHLQGSEPQLVGAGERGYNIVKYGCLFIAVAQDLGELDIPAADSETTGRLEAEGLCIVADSIEEARERVERLPFRRVPQLVDENYRGFNLVRFGEEVHGIACALGPLDLARLEETAIRDHEHLGRWVRGASIEEVRRRIDSVGHSPSPVVIESGYRGADNMAWERGYVGAAQALGPTNVALLEEATIQAQAHTGPLVANGSPDEAKQTVGALATSTHRAHAAVRSDRSNSVKGVPTGATEGRDNQELQRGRTVAECGLDADRGRVGEMRFARTLCLAFDRGAEDVEFLSALLAHVRMNSRRLALCGSEKLCQYVLEVCPWTKRSLRCIVNPNLERYAGDCADIPVVSLDEIPADVDTVLLCETRWDALVKMARNLRPDLRLVTFDAMVEIDSSVIPSRAWVPWVQSIYPIDIPDIAFLPDRDMILLDLPARSIAQMPAGFGYVHNALKGTGIRLQTVDCDIVVYHRYHTHRLLDGLREIRTEMGYALPEDPWQPIHYLEWEKPEFLAYFEPELEEICRKMIAARPKVIGLSLQQANLAFAREIIRRLKTGLPQVVIVVGGMSCLQPGAARLVMPEADYTVVGEADLIVGPLVQALVRGERPCDLPGVWSCYDSHDRGFAPGALPHDLDVLDFPRYEWTDIQLYRNWNGYQLTPVIGSRGCHWARCRFCGERFHWRARAPERVAGELEWLSAQGFTNFVFNESDLHGEPALLERLCDEILHRRLQIAMTAQLRCHVKADAQYYHKLRQAGFVCLRFGVDGGAANTLKRERKGYTKDLIRRNLRGAAEAGIFTEVNLVIGIPGETEADIEETIAFLIELKPYIGRLAFINPLMLFRGSDYWERPEEFGIRFRCDREALYDKYLVAIPDHEWYSTDPYIDKQVRYARLARVVTALRAVGMPMGDFANYTSERVEAHKNQTSDVPLIGQAMDERPLNSPFQKDVSAACADSVMGYRILVYEGRHYAVPEAMAGLDLRTRVARHNPRVLAAEGRGTLLALIERTVQQPVTPTPQLVETGCRGYDLYACDGVHIGCEAGKRLDLDAIRRNRFGRWVSGESVGDVRHLIERTQGLSNGEADARVLFVCDTSPDRVRAILDQLPFRDVTLLVSGAQRRVWPSYPIIDIAGRGADILPELKARGFDLAVVPYADCLGNEPWERHVAAFADQLLAVFPKGDMRLYRGNHLTRLVYNAAYLRSMFTFVPTLAGARVLEVGCSDGLTCDLLAANGAAAVDGVDPIQSVGLLYPNRNTRYQQTFGEKLAYDDGVFDVCYSIATLEHVSDPMTTVSEMARVTKRGGICYLQAGPLYASPFGHHMFGYFDDHPWIHLRLSKEEILDYCLRTDVGERIARERGVSAEEYIHGMLDPRHVNGRLIADYGLQEVPPPREVDVLRFAVSREGETLLTKGIVSELSPLTCDDLTTHGFEMVFRVR
jgi:radical SAM superfamily enzyme YgiQ (UPF0313 family)/SAM-dependent methyltransferase